MKSEIKVIASQKETIHEKKTRVGEIKYVAHIPECVQEAMNAGCYDIEKLRQIKKMASEKQEIQLEK
tara:strand:- start:10 stop:210 length:201 start_codon:yes stop_codon:yes gene_type:complete